MKGFVDAPNYFIELLEGGTTLEDVIDNHVYEQNLVSSGENWLPTTCQVALSMSVFVKKWNTAVLFLYFSLFDPILFFRLKRMHLLWPTLGP